MEWLFNNIRLRYAMASSTHSLLPSGTGANESMLAELNSVLRQTQTMHQAQGAAFATRLLGPTAFRERFGDV